MSVCVCVCVCVCDVIYHINKYRIKIYTRIVHHILPSIIFWYNLMMLSVVICTTLMQWHRNGEDGWCPFNLHVLENYHSFFKIVVYAIRQVWIYNCPHPPILTHLPTPLYVSL